LKRSRQLPDSVLAVVELGRAGEEGRGSAMADVCFENFVRIEQITQNEIETRKVIDQVCWKLTAASEEPGERRGIERANGVCIKPFLSQRRDALGAEDFQMRAGETIAQQFDGGQRQDKIADGAAANNQDAVQVSNA
jgi:hypothetical protein